MYKGGTGFWGDMHREQGLGHVCGGLPFLAYMYTRIGGWDVGTTCTGWWSGHAATAGDTGIVFCGCGICTLAADWLPWGTRC